MEKRLLTAAEQRDLLGEVCIRLGFCSLDQASRKMLATTPLTVDEFTDVVVRGETGGPDSTLKRHVRKIVADYYSRAGHEEG